MAGVQCSIWAVPLKIINICLFGINKLECATQNHDRDEGRSGGLLVRRDYSQSPCRWLQQLVSSLVLNRDVRESKDCVTHCVDSSSSRSVTSDDVLVGWETLPSGAGLPWGEEICGWRREGICVNMGTPITWYPKRNYIKLVMFMLQALKLDQVSSSLNQ